VEATKISERSHWKSDRVMKRFDWFEIALIVAVMSISLYAAFSDGTEPGHGAGSPATTPITTSRSPRTSARDTAAPSTGSTRRMAIIPSGWVCIPIFALARFDLILPLADPVPVMSGLSVATAILLYRLIGRVIAPAIGAIAARLLGLQCRMCLDASTSRDWKPASQRSSLSCSYTSWPEFERDLE
jgi:hypothetical protein